MDDSAKLALIVGLGNPGEGYRETRHNVGFWLVDRVAEAGGDRFRPDSRFNGELSSVTLAGARLRLLKPMTYMNRSGQPVGAVARFYRLEPGSVLVVHDDLDLPAGSVRLKVGGGHGGHNGLRDIINHLGSREFARLRIGIGHPGHRDAVTGHVLGRPGRDDRLLLDEALEAVIEVLPRLVDGQWQAVMQQLHSRGKP